MISPQVKQLADDLQKVIDRHKNLHVLVIIGKESKEDFFVFTNTCAACMLQLVHQFEEEAEPQHEGHIDDDKEIVH